MTGLRIGARVLEGLARNASTHAAGVVIADRPLTEYLPLCRGTNDEPITQYAMKSVEDIGLRSTKLRTPARTLIVIPNKAVAADAITNFSRMPQRRVEQVRGGVVPARGRAPLGINDGC